MHYPAWPPFSTGALAGGVRGGGDEGAERVGLFSSTADEDGK